MIPVRRNQFDVPGFASWLAANGCEVGMPTNMYEVIRYRAFWKNSSKAVVHIVYAKETGLLNYTGGSAEHYAGFAAGKELNTRNRAKLKGKTKATVKDRRRFKASERQGDHCWYCGEFMPEDDRTLEHLLAQSKGGGNDPANLVLAHEACNTLAADMSIADKVAMRERMRGALATGEAS